MAEQPAADALAAFLEAVVSPVVERAVRKAMSEGMPDPLEALTLQQAADLLGISKRSLQRYIARDNVPVLTMGDTTLRIRRASLDAWMRSKEQGGQPCRDEESSRKRPKRWASERKTPGRQPKAANG